MVAYRTYPPIAFQPLPLFGDLMSSEVVVFEGPLPELHQPVPEPLLELNDNEPAEPADEIVAPITDEFVNPLVEPVVQLTGHPFRVVFESTTAISGRSLEGTRVSPPMTKMNSCVQHLWSSLSSLSSILSLMSLSSL